VLEKRGGGQGERGSGKKKKDPWKKRKVDERQLRFQREVSEVRKKKSGRKKSKKKGIHGKKEQHPIPRRESRVSRAKRY